MFTRRSRKSVCYTKPPNIKLPALGGASMTVIEAGTVFRGKPENTLSALSRACTALDILVMISFLPPASGRPIDRIVEVNLLGLKPNLPLLCLYSVKLSWLHYCVKDFTKWLHASAECILQVRFPWTLAFSQHGWNDVRRGDRMEISFVHREEEQQASL